MDERRPDFREQDSGVPTTASPNPDPLQPQHSVPAETAGAGADGGSLAEHVRDRTGGGDPGAERPASGEHGGPAVGEMPPGEDQPFPPTGGDAALPGTERRVPSEGVAEAGPATGL